VRVAKLHRLCIYVCKYVPDKKPVLIETAEQHVLLPGDDFDEEDPLQLTRLLLSHAK
jgi:hypothetical protein